MTPEQILTLLSALMSGEPDVNRFETIATALENPAYQMAITPCARPVAPAEIDGKTVLCGTLEVPEDHASPEGRQITLRWIVYKAHSLSPAPDPVIYLHGGPGGGTVRTVAAVSQYFDHLRQRRDIISFDQRGVDASAPDMDCFGTLAENLDASVRTIEGEDTPELPLEFAQGCVAEIASRGIDITKINTSQNAQDVGMLMAALGYPQYNIYGVSYGTKLTLEVLRQQVPDIRSVVLDGVAPPQVPLYDTLFTPYAASFTNTFAPCERDPVCAEAYPDITARFYTLLDTLTETPVKVQGEEFNGEQLFFFIKGRNERRSQNPNKISTYLPLMVKQLEDGDTTLLTQLVNEDLPPAITADTLFAQAFSLGLSPDEQALITAATTAAKTIDITSDMALEAIQRLESDLARDSAALGLADLFDDKLGEAIAAMPTREARLAVGRDYLNLRFADPEALKLSGLIGDHFSGATAAQLKALLQAMTAKDIAGVFALIGLDNQALEDAIEGEFEAMLYACQEDFVDGFNSSEGYLKETLSLPFGAAIDQSLTSDIPELFKICDTVFTPVPRENWLAPVVSDQRVLLMNGEIDVQTAFDWGALAAESLSNSQNLVFPESGHGTILFSQCARDITAAFIQNPDTTLNTGCIKNLRPPVMLPDGTMHPLPL